MDVTWIENLITWMFVRGGRVMKRRVLGWAAGAIASAITPAVVAPHMHRPTLQGAMLMMEQSVSAPISPWNSETMKRNSEANIAVMNKAMQKH